MQCIYYIESGPWPDSIYYIKIKHPQWVHLRFNKSFEDKYAAIQAVGASVVVPSPEGGTVVSDGGAAEVEGGAAAVG